MSIKTLLRLIQFPLSHSSDISWPTLLDVQTLSLWKAADHKLNNSAEDHAGEVGVEQGADVGAQLGVAELAARLRCKF